MNQCAIVNSLFEALCLAHCLEKDALAVDIADIMVKHDIRYSLFENPNTYRDEGSNIVEFRR